MKTKITFLFLSFLSFSFANAQEGKVWTLKECVDYALENNISIKQVALDRASSLEDVTAAKWNFAPNLNAFAGQNYNFGSSISASGARASADFRSNNVSLNSSITLFDGFANINNLQQAKIGVKAQEAALAKIKNDISLNVVNAYLQVLFAKEQEKIAQTQVDISWDEVLRREALVQVGVIPAGELLNIKSTLASDNQNLIVAQNTFSLTTLRLAQLLQLNETSILIEDLDVDTRNQSILNSSANTIYNKASETFPEIKLAELNILSAEKNIQIAKASYYPTLSLSYGLNTIYQHRQGSPDPNGFSFSDQFNDNLGNSVSISLNIPIFNRFQFKTNVSKAKISQQRIEYDLERQKQQLRETIQTAYADALAAAKSYDAGNISVESQYKAFQYAEERFAVGAITTFDFNQAKNSLAIAQSELIRSKYDFVFKLKVLDFYNALPFVVE